MIFQKNYGTKLLFGVDYSCQQYLLNLLKSI
jgi:hypothetical protein